MLALIKRTIFVRRKSLLIYIIISALLVWMFVVFFPSMHQQAEELSKAFANYPESFLKAFGFDRGTIGNILFNIESFLAIEHYSIMWPIIVLVLTVSLGSSFLSGEVDEGTIEILLAQPLSRSKIYFSKYIAGFLIISIFVLASVFSVIPFALLHDVDINLKSHLMVAGIGLLFSLAIFSVSMMFSSMFSDKGKSTSISAGIMLGMYALNLFSSLKESAENLRYVSFFYYFDFQAAMLDHKIALLNVCVFLGVILICSIVGMVVFVKRDFAT